MGQRMKKDGSSKYYHSLFPVSNDREKRELLRGNKNSPLPTPYSLLPTPYSPFPIPHTNNKG
jgi:hypothetical protein